MSHSSESRRLGLEFEPGDMVAVRFGIGLSHYGVVTQRGTVISNSRKNNGVVEQSFFEFADGRTVRLCGRREGLDALPVEARARKALGARYSLTHSNCSHFTRWTYRRQPTAMQIASATLSALRDLASNSRKRRY